MSPPGRPKANTGGKPEGTPMSPPGRPRANTGGHSPKVLHERCRYRRPLPSPSPAARAAALRRAGARCPGALLKPDRVALYAYAHLPQRFKPQRRIDEAALPSAEQPWRCSSRRSRLPGAGLPLRCARASSRSSRLALTRDDLVRRAVIMALMFQAVDFETIESAT